MKDSIKKLFVHLNNFITKLKLYDIERFKILLDVLIDDLIVKIIYYVKQGDYMMMDSKKIKTFSQSIITFLLIFQLDEEKFKNILNKFKKNYFKLSKNLQRTKNALQLRFNKIEQCRQQYQLIRGILTDLF